MYRFKTETRNDWFDITLEEQIRLKVKTTEAKNEKSKRQMREKRKKDGAVSNEELREEIIRTIAEHPDMKDYKVAKLVKEKLGKCSKNTVQKVREEMEK